MGAVTWDDSYKVNVDEIDSQHKTLFDLINRLENSVKSEEAHNIVASVYTELANYAVYHFNHEEALMRKAGFPDFNMHIKMHKALVGKVVELKTQYESGSTTVINDAILFLTSWIKDHIKGEDQKYSPFMHEQGIK